MSESVVVPPRVAEGLQRFGENMAWARRNEALLSKHEGKFVAVDEGKILAADEDPRRLRKRFVEAPFVYVVFVAPKGFAWFL